VAISVFPTPVTTSSSINASSITATSANTLYEGRIALDPAIYTITCTSTTVATLFFYSGTNTLVTTAVTASGTVAINLASTVDRVRLYTNTGSNIVVTITKTAGALSNVFSGTLDTLTSSGTYTGTSTSGYGYAIIIGGGGGGGNGTQNGYGGGGGAGGSCGKLLTLTGSMAFTIGAAGVGSGGNGTAGGQSTFGEMTAGGGGGGQRMNNQSPIQGTNGTATGGDINLSGGGPNAGYPNNPGYSGNPGNGPGSPYPFVVTTPGVGGFGNTTSGGAGTGYGAGGGGGGYDGGSGGNGTPGVLYVLKF
jgi:hypothetical protein